MQLFLPGGVSSAGSWLMHGPHLKALAEGLPIFVHFCVMQLTTSKRLSESALSELPALRLAEAGLLEQTVQGGRPGFCSATYRRPCCSLLAFSKSGTALSGAFGG